MVAYVLLCCVAVSSWIFAQKNKGRWVSFGAAPGTAQRRPKPEGRQAAGRSVRGGGICCSGSVRGAGFYSPVVQRRLFHHIGVVMLMACNPSVLRR